MEHSRLPLDVYHEIIDALALNPKDLAACALTAREWFPRARFCLYNKVVLHGEKKCLAFSQALLDSSALGPLVRDLMMLPTTKGRGQNPINNFQYDPFPLPAVRTLSNLKSMALEFDGGEPTTSILTLLRETASLPSIRMLGIGSFTFQSVDDLVDILVAGPHLTGVHVSACLFNNEFRTDDGRPDFALDYCRELRTVVVSFTPVRASYCNLSPLCPHVVHGE